MLKSAFIIALIYFSLLTAGAEDSYKCAKSCRDSQGTGDRCFTMCNRLNGYEDCIPACNKDEKNSPAKCYELCGAIKFPTPKGFTMNPNNRWNPSILIPQHIADRFVFFGKSLLAKTDVLTLCDSIVGKGTPSFAYKGRQYRMRTGIAEWKTNSSSKGVERSLRCDFSWMELPKHAYVKESPIYYIKR